MIYVYYNDDTFQEIAESLYQALIKLKFTVQLLTRIDDQKIIKEEDLFIMLGLNNETPYLPPRYIAYQFEQTGNKNSWFTNDYLNKLRGAIEIWDYSIVNIQNLKKEYPDLPVIRYVPLGYTSNLHKIVQNESKNKKYDILFYGSSCPRRDSMIKDLRNEGFRVYYAEFSLWNDERDRLIADSKIVLNLHYYPKPILETSRLSYLIANEAFVISEPSIDPILDKEYSNYVIFSEYDNIVETCKKYIIDDDDISEIPERTKGIREEYAHQAYLKFMEKDFSKVIPIESLNIILQNSSEKTISKPLSSTSIQTTTKTAKDMIKSLLTETSISERKGKIRGKFKSVEFEITKDGDAKLKGLEELKGLEDKNYPMVSIITPTQGRTWALMSLAMRNFYSFDYPKEKMEWIIIDSDPSEPINFPKDERIKYHLVSGNIPLWQRRNMGVEQSKGDIIVHMDDDDYYFESSLKTKVKLLLKYHKEEGIECIGCTELGIYHLLDNYSYMSDTKYISEASMAYTKNFWIQKPYQHRNLEMGEGFAFVENREHQVMTMPYYFNFIALTHGHNYTGNLRTNEKQKGNNQYDNFFNLWDRQTQYFMLELKTKAEKALALNKKTKSHKSKKENK